LDWRTPICSQFFIKSNRNRDNFRKLVKLFILFQMILQMLEQNI